VCLPYINLLQCNGSGSTIRNYTFYPKSAFACLVWVLGQTVIFHYRASPDWFYNIDGVCLLRGSNLIFKYNLR
jgi:hypothetical protein